VAKAAEVVGECRRMIAGQQLFAKVKLRMEPAPQSAVPVMLITSVPPDTVPPDLLTAALEELKACGEGGGRIAGYPLMKLKVTVLAAEWNSEQTDERAMKIAAADAFEKGLEAGGKVLLEPIMKVDIVTPDEYLGDFVGDLQQRRGTIAKTENRGKFTAIEAHAPLKELFGYSSAMRSLSQGRASCSMAWVICWRVSSLSLQKLGSWPSTCRERLTGSIRSTQSTWPIRRRVVMMLPTVRLDATCALWLSSISVCPSGQCCSVHRTSAGESLSNSVGMRCQSWVR